MAPAQHRGQKGPSGPEGQKGPKGGGKGDEPPADALPEGWKDYFDEESNQPFYFHIPTGKWQWERPWSSDPPQSVRKYRRADFVSPV